MSTLVAAAQNTHSKTWLRNKYRVFALLAAAASVWCAVSAFAGRTFHAGDLTLSLTGSPFTMLELLNVLWVPLLSFMMASDFFASELSGHAIKFEVLRPIGRSGLYLSKMAGMLLYCAELYAGSLLIHAVLAILFRGAYVLPFLLAGSLMSLLVALTFVSVSCFVANLLGHASLAMFVLILVYAVMSFVGSAFPQFGVFFFTSYLNWYKMFAGSHIPWSGILSSVAMLLSTIGMTTALGQWLFDRKDLD